MTTGIGGGMVAMAAAMSMQRGVSKPAPLGLDGKQLSSSDGISLTHPGESRDVYSWFEITLQDINVPDQSFTASIEIHLWWQDFNLPNVFPAFAKQNFSLNEDSLPFKLSEIFENKTSLDITGEPQYSYFPETGTIYAMLVVQCNFYERMELQRFPLDRQFMNMQFNAYWKTENGDWNWILPKDVPEWIPEDFKDKCAKGYVTRMVSSITEYELLGPWIAFNQPEKDEDPIAIRLRVNRKPAFYFGNVVLPNFLIVAGCFSAFVIPPSDVADRLAITVTLMLAAVAFRFVVSTMLPKVSYLTLMDYYILIGFIALVLLIFENAVVGIGSLDDDTRVDIDYIFGLLFGATWLIIHAFALCALCYDNFLRITWERMDEIDKEADPDADLEYPTKIEAAQPSDDYWNRFKNIKPNERSKSISKPKPQKDESKEELKESKEELKESEKGKVEPIKYVPSKIEEENVNPKQGSKPEQNLAAYITLQEKIEDKDEVEQTESQL